MVDIRGGSTTYIVSCYSPAAHPSHLEGTFLDLPTRCLHSEVKLLVTSTNDHL